jgi:F-type H+-transporting ATPase subunit b
MDVLDIQFGPIIWTVVNFLLLLILLRAVAWKPILRALESRETAISDAIDRAERAKADAERILAENQKSMQLADAEAQKVLRESRELAERMQNEASQRAQLETRRMLEQANAEIERSKQQALTELRAEVATLAVEGAERILRESLDGDRHRRIVDQYLSQTTVAQ